MRVLFPLPELENISSGNTTIGYNVTQTTYVSTTYQQMEDMNQMFNVSPLSVTLVQH